jgi:hypothetical protein
MLILKLQYARRSRRAFSALPIPRSAYQRRSRCLLPEVECKGASDAEPNSARVIAHRATLIPSTHEQPYCGHGIVSPREHREPLASLRTLSRLFRRFAPQPRCTARREGHGCSDNTWVQSARRCRRAQTMASLAKLASKTWSPTPVSLTCSAHRGLFHPSRLSRVRSGFDSRPGSLSFLHFSDLQRQANLFGRSPCFSGRCTVRWQRRKGLPRRGSSTRLRWFCEPSPVLAAAVRLLHTSVRYALSVKLIVLFAQLARVSHTEPTAFSVLLCAVGPIHRVFSALVEA